MEKRSPAGLRIKKSYRQAAFVLAVLALLASFLFIVIEAGHDCEGEDCAVCACIQMCSEQLDHLSFVNALPCIIISAAMLCAAPLLCADLFLNETLVSRKVRLND